MSDFTKILEIQYTDYPSETFIVSSDSDIREIENQLDSVVDPNNGYITFSIDGQKLFIKLCHVRNIFLRWPEDEEIMEDE